MSNCLYVQEQDAHHVLHLDVEGNDLLFIVATLLLKGIDSLES